MRLPPLLPLLATGSLCAQVVIDGRLQAPDSNDSAAPFPLSTVLAIAHLPGPESEALSFRTWETEPAGWFQLSGLAGRYTLAFTNPAHFMRPMILTNQFVRDGERLDLRLTGPFDFACFSDRAWDPKPAQRYLQPFTARGTGVTAVGFKLATDGVDGGGPGKQDVLISIHERTEGDPGTWPQVGPTATVLDVDCGGPKSYWFSAGWESGEVPIEPGREYAVSIRPANPEATIQTFWRPRLGGSPGVYRFATERHGYEPHDMWLAVSSDRDGLVIPYNKRVHRKFSSLTTLEKKWSQTWIPMGRGLASVVLYAAVSGKQPPLSRQRVAVRVRENGPDGPVVGIEKIAVGNGDYTGDASWGHFVAVFAPGEVTLEPGQTYALEFESIETAHTIGDFVNIKQQVSDGRAGFNPYQKCEPDDYRHGTAYRGGNDAQDFDLDLQIVEYEEPRDDWEGALAGPELLVNGTMEGRDSASDVPLAWQPFRAGESTRLDQVDLGDPSGAILRVSVADSDHAVDGGWVQRIAGLERSQTYRLSGRVRSSWPAGNDHRAMVGLDPTGQIDDPGAETIQWSILPKRHGEFLPFLGDPRRPAADTVSVWLRATCTRDDGRFPFQAEFDDFSLRRVDTGVPTRIERTARMGFTAQIPPEDPAKSEDRLAIVRMRRANTPVLVHRGASRFAPENSLEAYAAAIDRGADGFEIDIRRSRDGILYVFHDDTLDRVTKGTGPVRGLSYFDLLEFELGEGGSRIPTLAAVFTLARKRGALLHLDIKEPGLEPDILRLIGDADLWEHIVTVNDYNAASIRSHPRIQMLNYKGWFPEIVREQQPFLQQAGEMVFTKWDPLDAVRALGRDERKPEPIPESWRAVWEANEPHPTPAR